MNNPLHPVQVSILRSLRHMPTARFSTLMHAAGMQSDDFKFHLRKVVLAGYVAKDAAGAYALTAAGKEYANNLDETRRTVQRQPKISLLVLVQKPQTSGEPLYLFQERLRSPFYGYWSAIGGRAQWGEAFEETAAAELYKQTGLRAQCAVRSMFRQRDYAEQSKELLEDKVFIVIEATQVAGVLQNGWLGGRNAWMTLADYQQQALYFPSVCEAITMLATRQLYQSRITRYTEQQY